MRGLGHHFRVSLRLYFRNRMAMLYGYLFPTVFLVAFYVLYRYERVPLVRHMGELLTVTILGGACFGLATTLVADRERGVWRRFKLAPVPTTALIGTTIAARYVLLLTAGLLQLALALMLGMPWPAHPVELFIAFSLASFAFLGLGLVIAMLADNVPAVQALGQSIFLPMLIVGGVAVPLTALPEWAQRISTFLPGRYSVDAIQASVAGTGLTGSVFSLIALIAIGAAACLAGGGLFRWDAQQRFVARRGTMGWLSVALSAWLAVGVAAHYRDYGRPSGSVPATAEAVREASQNGALSEAPTPSAPVIAQEPIEPQATAVVPASPDPASAAPAPLPSMPTPPGGSPAVSTQPSTVSVDPDDWRAVTLQHIDRDLVYTRLPPDAGVVTPIAPADVDVDEATWQEVDMLRTRLSTWEPSLVVDPLERVRNLLLVAGVIDVLQLPIESLVPLVIFDRIQQEVQGDDLIKLLYRIAIRPDEGSTAALGQMYLLGIPDDPNDLEEVYGRASVYAVKLIGRITGKRPGR